MVNRILQLSIVDFLIWLDEQLDGLVVQNKQKVANGEKSKIKLSSLQDELHDDCTQLFVYNKSSESDSNPKNSDAFLIELSIFYLTYYTKLFFWYHGRKKIKRDPIIFVSVCSSCFSFSSYPSSFSYSCCCTFLLVFFWKDLLLFSV